ncbi:hypothetical protein ACS25C_04080 [Dickeya undicola]|uniref:hypothetical protein n=1 Tax=Dickeya undicola TaxID=1577887 RepID=UPI003F25A067
MRFIALVIMVASFSSMAANEKNNVNDLMLNAKWAGMCGVIKQMISFQEANKIPGGGDFVDKFIASERLRLGLSQIQLIESCNRAASVYSDSYKRAN